MPGRRRRRTRTTLPPIKCNDRRRRAEKLESRPESRAIESRATSQSVTQEAARAKQQNDNEQRETKHALSRRCDVESSERFGHTDQYAADQRAGHGAEAADDHNHESEKRVGGAEAGRQ